MGVPAHGAAAIQQQDVRGIGLLAVKTDGALPGCLVAGQGNEVRLQYIGNLVADQAHHPSARETRHLGQHGHVIEADLRQMHERVAHILFPSGRSLHGLTAEPQNQHSRGRGEVTGKYQRPSVERVDLGRRNALLRAAKPRLEEKERKHSREAPDEAGPPIISGLRSRWETEH